MHKSSKLQQTTQVASTDDSRISGMSFNVRYISKFLVGFMCLSFMVGPATSEGAELKKETQQA